MSQENTEQSAIPETSASRYAQLEALQEQVAAVERDLRAIRARLAALMRCTCPAGWGQERDANCPKHGGAAVAVDGVCVGGEFDGQRVPACPECGGAIVCVEYATDGPPLVATVCENRHRVRSAR